MRECTRRLSTISTRTWRRKRNPKKVLLQVALQEVASRPLSAMAGAAKDPTALAASRETSPLLVSARDALGYYSPLLQLQVLVVQESGGVAVLGP